MISPIYSTPIPLTEIGKRKGKTKNQLEREFVKGLVNMSANWLNPFSNKKLAGKIFERFLGSEFDGPFFWLHYIFF